MKSRWLGSSFLRCTQPALFRAPPFVCCSTLRPSTVVTLTSRSFCSSQSKAESQRADNEENEQSGFDDNTHSSQATAEEAQGQSEEQEFAYDPAFDALLHGVFNREDFEKRDGKIYANIGLLGRLFIYQYESCPYSGKVKAFLDRFDIMYSLIEVNPLSKKQLPDTKHFMHDRQVPVLMASRMVGSDMKSMMNTVNHRVLYQSNAIIEGLMHYLVTRDSSNAKGSSNHTSNHSDSSVIITHDFYERSHSDIVKEWVSYADNTIVPLMYCYCDSNDDFVKEMFSYLSEFQKFKQLGGLTNTPMNVAVGKVFRNQCMQIRHKYAVSPGVEYDRLLEGLQEWHYVTQHTFHGGSDLDLADVCMFGILRTYARMSFFDELLKDAELFEWYAACEDLVGKHSCISHF